MIVETRRKARYPQRLSQYARTYGRSIETIKAWIKRGKLAGCLPPLQSRAEFSDWYAEHVGVVPDDLLAVCLSDAHVAAVESAPESSNGDGERAAAAVPLLDLE